MSENTNSQPIASARETAAASQPGSIFRPTADVAATQEQLQKYYKDLKSTRSPEATKALMEEMRARIDKGKLSESDLVEDQKRIVNEVNSLTPEALRDYARQLTIAGVLAEGVWSTEDMMEEMKNNLNRSVLAEIRDRIFGKLRKAK